MLLPTRNLVNRAGFLQIKGFGRLTCVLVLSEHVVSFAFSAALEHRVLRLFCLHLDSKHKDWRTQRPNYRWRRGNLISSWEL